MFHRAIGSIQSGARLGRVTKGHNMPGHMGNARITTQNLEVIKVDKENNLILIKGAVPGHKNNYVMLKEAKKMLKEVIGEFDHSYLNETGIFKNSNPTSENIAKFIYDVLKKKDAHIYSISVWENDNSCATYRD